MLDIICSRIDKCYLHNGFYHSNNVLWMINIVCWKHTDWEIYIVGISNCSRRYTILLHLCKHIKKKFTRPLLKWRFTLHLAAPQFWHFDSDDSGCVRCVINGTVAARTAVAEVEIVYILVCQLFNLRTDLIEENWYFCST